MITSRSAVGGLVASVAITLVTWTQLWHFDQSLHVSSLGQTVSRIIVFILGIAALAVPAYGGRAVLRGLRARALTRDGRLPDARITAEDAGRRSALRPWLRAHVGDRRVRGVLHGLEQRPRAQRAL